MKLLFIFILPVIFFSTTAVNSNFAEFNFNDKRPTKVAGNQREGNMSAIEFKSQDFCRAEAPDFEFETKFSVVSATVYFSGANFRGVEKGFISSNSLKPVAAMKARCIPGSIVTFDQIKVIGPDKQVRVIQGVSYLLY